MGKWDKYNGYILENKDKSQSNIARGVYMTYGLDPSNFQAIRHHVKRLLKKYQSHSALEEYCEAHGIPENRVSGYWHKGEYNDVKMSVRVSSSEEESMTLDDIKEAVKSVLSAYKPVKLESQAINMETALKVTISDAHVGLDPDPNGESLFNYEYNKEIFLDNLTHVYNSVITEYKEHGCFELFVLDDLGDGLDGFDGFTTRGGHKLDQNMTNKEAFEVYVKGKYDLIRAIMEAGVAKKYVIRNVSNCNHGGDFGWIANRAIQYMLECSVEGDYNFVIMDKFMEHFEWGHHTFILTHGKDKKHMKHGMPLILNDKAINFINEYIDHYEIKSKHIHVEKGDLHQVSYQRTKKFDYRNYMSFAPPSAWVTTNFGDAYSGYSVELIPKYNNRIKHTDHFFDLKKKM